MSSALVLSFRQHPSNSYDWSQQELAEFYRIESALLQSGFAVTTDRGVTDEGDPWFVFCREDTEEVIAHFARIGREYLISSNFHQGVLRGRDFRTLVRDILESHPLMTPVRRRQGQKVYLHPAALLMALVASAYLISNENQSSGDAAASDGHGKNTSTASLLMQKFSIFAAAVFAVTWIEHNSHALAGLFDKSSFFHALFGETVDHASASPQLSDLETGLQTVNNVELGGHHKVLTTEEAHTQPQHDSEHQVSFSLLSVANAPGWTVAKSGDSGQANLPDSSTTLQNVDGSPSHVDYGAGGPNSLQQTAVPKIAQNWAVNPADMQSQSATPESGQSLITAASSDAFHVAAAELGNLASSTIVLSTGPVSLNQALQQAFLQAGIDPGLLHNGSPGEGSSNAALGPGAGVHSDLVSPTSVPSSSGSSPAAAVTNPSASIDAQVQQFVDAFLHVNPSVEVTLSGQNVVIMDTNPSDAKSGHFNVVTFDMSDGSTLSVVGIIPGHAQPMSAGLTA